MNKRNKEKMLKQQQKIIDFLENDFPNIPINEDELSESETPGVFNNFLIIYGDFVGTSSIGQLNQEIYVVYLSENKEDLETMSIDIISSMNKVPGLEFIKTIKRRAKKKDTDSYVDQITFVFKRLVKYERNISD